MIAALSREGCRPRPVSRATSAARGFYRSLMLDGHIKRHPPKTSTRRRGSHIFRAFLARTRPKGC